MSPISPVAKGTLQLIVIIRALLALQDMLAGASVSWIRGFRRRHELEGAKICETQESLSASVSVDIGSRPSHTL